MVLMAAADMWEFPDRVLAIVDRKPVCATCARAVPIGMKDVRCDSELWERRGRQMPHSKVGCCSGYERRES